MSLRSLTFFLVLWLNHAAAQATTPATPRSCVIHAAHMIDGRSDVVQNDVAVIVEGANERIHGDARSRNRGRLVRRKQCAKKWSTALTGSSSTLTADTISAPTDGFAPVGFTA